MTTRQKALAVATMELQLGHYDRGVWCEAEKEASITGDTVELCYVNLRVGQLRLECKNEAVSEETVLNEVSLEDIERGLNARSRKAMLELLGTVIVLGCMAAFVVKGMAVYA